MILGQVENVFTHHLQSFRQIPLVSNNLYYTEVLFFPFYSVKVKRKSNANNDAEEKKS